MLTEVRVELHRSAGRELDRLLLQEQDHVADVLAYPDADALMAAVSEAGRAIAWVSEDAWRRRRFWQPEPTRRPGGGSRRRGAGHGADGGRPPPDGRGRAGRGHRRRRGGPHPRRPRWPTDSSLPLRLAAVAAERELPIARGALHRLADKMAPPPDPWPVETRQALVRVLAAGRPAVDALEALDQQGLLVRILPEWAAVRNRPQRNAYHRFTVDRHLLEAAANAADARRPGRPARPAARGHAAPRHRQGLPRRPHRRSASSWSASSPAAWASPPADVETLVDLCRLHLLLPDTATRRDLDDPTTIETVAQAVGDRLDPRACWAPSPRPTAWPPAPRPGASWKAGLVAELVQRTGRFLEGDGPPSGQPAAAPGSPTSTGRLMDEVRAGGRPAVLLEPPRVVVAAPDRRGLLASVAGTLALHGLDVRSADAVGEDGVAAEVFTVEVGRGAWPDSARLREDLEAVLSDRLALAERLAEQGPRLRRARRPSAARPVVPAGLVDNDGLGHLHRGRGAGPRRGRPAAPGDPGAVRLRARRGLGPGLDLGDAVVDAFYVRDARRPRSPTPRPSASSSDRCTPPVG